MRVAERLEQRESHGKSSTCLIARVGARAAAADRPSRSCGWASFIARPARI